MSFLNPFFLIGSLTLAIPVLIHLVRREKSEVIRFSTLMFLLKIPKRAVRQQKLKNLLLMLLRLAILALLVVAFMRPYLTDSSTPAAATSKDHGIVMLLDNSYSMRYGTNMDKMKSEANKRIDAMADNDRMSLVVFNDKATVTQRPSSDKSQLKAEVASIEPSFYGTRYYDAFTTAGRVLQQYSKEQKQLIMISDFQRVGWNRSSRENVIGKDVKAEMVDLGIEKSNNVGIDNVSVDTTSFTRTFGGRVNARIHNYRKDLPVTVPVSLSINDKEVARKSVNVPANSTVLADFTGFDLPMGPSKGKVRIEAEDPLMVDNEFLFSLVRLERLKVLVIDTGKLDAGGRGQSYFLQRAFAALTDLPMDVTHAKADDVQASDLPMYGVVIVNDVPALSDGVRDRLLELRKTGRQGQMVILGPNANLNWWGNYAGLPVKPTQKIVANQSLGKTSVAVTSFDRNHAIFKKFQNSAVFTLNSAQFYRYTQLELKPGATALAKFEDGSPAMAEFSGQDRGLIVFASSVDNAALTGWNDFPLKTSFQPMFNEVARYLSHSDDVREWYSLGEGIPVVGSLVGGAAAVISPGGERVALGDLEAGEQRFYTPTVPGFHEIRVGRDIRVVAVNPPSNEGNLDIIPKDELLASVQSTAAEAQQAGLFASDDQLDHAKRQLSWWYLLLIAILAAIAEIYIANNSQRAPSGTPIPGQGSGSSRLGFGRN